MNSLDPFYFNVRGKWRKLKKISDKNGCDKACRFEMFNYDLCDNISDWNDKVIE